MEENICVNETKESKRRAEYCIRIQKAFENMGKNDGDCEDIPSILVDFEEKIKEEQKAAMEWLMKSCQSEQNYRIELQSSNENLIERMHEYEAKKLQGKLVELPCNINDTVYFVYNFNNNDENERCIGLEEGKVICIKHQKDGILFQVNYSIGIYWHKEEDIGESIFFVEEEAKKKLEEL